MVVRLRKILVSRTDKLGDFMLTWPSLSLLKAAVYPACVDLLVDEAVAEIAGACPYTGGVLIDKGQPVSELADLVRGNGYDAAIALFSTTRVARVLRVADIPYRLGPATKVAQWLYTDRRLQRRSRSLKPEYVYNSDLVTHFLDRHGIDQPSTAPPPPYWQFDQSELESVRRDLNEYLGIDPAAQLVVIHPGSGGSANNLSSEQYAAIANRLGSRNPVHVVVTAGPGEATLAKAVHALIHQNPSSVFVSSEGLVAFSRVLATASVFVSGSTGPLHIAGALNIRTAAFYPRKRSSTALRWQTTNAPDRRLAFEPPVGAGESEMAAIDPAMAAHMVSRHFLATAHD